MSVQIAVSVPLKAVSNVKRLLHDERTIELATEELIRTGGDSKKEEEMIVRAVVGAIDALPFDITATTDDDASTVLLTESVTNSGTRSTAPPSPATTYAKPAIRSRSIIVRDRFTHDETFEYGMGRTMEGLLFEYAERSGGKAEAFELHFNGKVYTVGNRTDFASVGVMDQSIVYVFPRSKGHVGGGPSTFGSTTFHSPPISGPGFFGPAYSGPGFSGQGLPGPDFPRPWATGSAFPSSKRVVPKMNQMPPRSKTPTGFDYCDVRSDVTATESNTSSRGKIIDVQVRDLMGRVQNFEINSNNTLFDLGERYIRCTGLDAEKLRLKLPNGTVHALLDDMCHRSLESYNIGDETEIVAMPDSINF